MGELYTMTRRDELQEMREVRTEMDRENPRSRRDFNEGVKHYGALGH